MNPVEAEKYMKRVVEQREGDPQAMYDMALFYLKWNKLGKAESYMRDALSFDIKN